MSLFPQDFLLLKPGDDFDDDGWLSTVVVNFETGEFALGYELSGWGDDPGGLLVLTVEAGLVRHPRYCFEIAIDRCD